MNVDTNLPHRIISDKSRLSQILINLVSNAIKFTNPGKSVRVDISLYHGEPCCDAVEQEIGAGPSMIVRVHDEGIGISKENMHKLFQPFFQVSRNSVQGSGLGLYICRELVHLLHGHICCHSQLGNGSTFTAVVPLAVVASHLSKSKSESQSSEVAKISNLVTSKYRVLVAEDNRVNQAVIRSLLDRLGCQFDIVSDGQQAVEAFEQGSYFLILMDLMMPVMDGFEAAHRITSSAQYAINQPRVVALTASVTEDEVQAAHRAGCHSVLSKPVTMKKLAEAIDVAARHYHERTRTRFVLGISQRDFSFFPE
jgi:CheY-like chemotaxis protein